MEIILLIITLIVASAETAVVYPSYDIHRAASRNGFQSNIRRLNRNQLTKIELLQIAAKGDNERLRKIVRAKTGSMQCVTISSHIQQSSAGFIMNLSIGTPAQPPFSALIDTGSDLIWTKCKPSFNKSTPVFDPERSSSYSELKCNSDRCKSLLSNDSSCGKLGECTYKYGYGDNTSTKGVLATETFTFEGNHPVSNLDFGCGLDNKGPHIEELAGIVGLGRGNMSLVSQMKEPRFSYCLPEFDSGETGVLSVGGGYVNTAPRGGKTTPLINNPFNPTFYYLSLQGITIGNTRLRINKTNFEIKPNGTGGLIIDSGTTLTFLEKCAFNQVKKELTRQIKLPSFDGRTAVGFELCYNLTRPAETINFPNITFHFLGQGADFEVIPGNYFVLADENETTGCLVMGSSSSDEMSIFGNFQQQNALVVYDLAQNKLSYLPNTKCSTAT